MTVSFWLFAATATWLSYYFFSPLPKARRLHIPKSQHLPSALIPSYTSHARLLPTPARHAFSYPLIYLGVDIDALESGLLDLPNRLLVYGGSPWSKILGLRPDGYLSPDTQSLRSKINGLLEKHGLELGDVGKAWLVTMPSFLGVEGINPLSVWYVYDRKGAFLSCVLEVHNTFEEKHAYVLRVNSEYSQDPKPGHDHAWTFPRTFHVSPFNSRNGYYRLDLLDPFPSHSIPSDHPQYKVSLRLLTPAKETKLTAILASHPIHRSIPLEPENLFKLIRAIARWPLSLFLSTPRILYHAWQLHYDKKLAVFPRPEPRQEGQKESWNPPQNYVDDVSTPVRGQVTGLAGKLSRSIVSKWAMARAVETSIQLEIKYHGTGTSTIFPSLPGLDSWRKLAITTSSPKLYSQLLIAPTPEHFLILAPELLTTISDPALFRHFFNPNPSTVPNRTLDKWIQAVQARCFLWQSGCSFIAPPPDLIHPPDRHFTSSGLSALQKLGVMLVIWLAFFGDWVEEELMRVMQAKWVPGGDPQRIWERALKRQYKLGKQGDGQSDGERDNEGWEEVGSLLY